MDTPLQQNDNVQPNADQQNDQNTEKPSGDRTGEQFEKLKTNNSELHQQNELLRQQLEFLKKEAPKQANQTPTPAPQKQAVEKIPDEIDLNSYVEIDPKTGEKYINETKLTSAIRELQEKTSKAESTIQSYIKTNEERRIEQQKNIAFNAYPELEPGSEKFDKTFFKTVRAVLYDSMMNANEYGNTLTLKEAADYVRGNLIKTPQSSDKKDGDGDSNTKNSVSNSKAQAGTLVPSQPQNTPSPEASVDLERLRLATRKGNVEALAKRILNTDHVLKKA